MFGLLYLLLATRVAFGGKDPIKGDPWYHAEMTWRAAKDAKWSAGNDEKDDTTPAAALAWHADYVDSYLYNPLWWAAGGLPRFKVSLLHHHDLVKLHFDDLNSISQVQLMWRRYKAGTVAGLMWAAERDDVHAARNIVGAGIHAQQDFYSHSNWVDEPSRRDLTWHQAWPAPRTGPDPRDEFHVYTGAYEQPVQKAYKSHGKYGFDCAVYRKLPSKLMDAICFAASPMSNTGICQRYKECRDGTGAKPETILGASIPVEVLVLAPPGINLDTPWMAEIGVKNRDLPDKGEVTGKELFTSAKTLATRHTVEWLTSLAEIMQGAGLSAFWDRVMSEPRTGARPTFTDLDMERAFFGGYESDLVQYDEPARAPFVFLSAGAYPPNTDGSDEGWFLRLDIATSSDALSGTNADIFADVDGKSFLLDRMHERTPAGGLTEMRILEHNDFEAGSKDTYVVGPFAALPRQLSLRNSAASALDVVVGAWKDLERTAAHVVDSARDFLLSIVAGHADHIGQDKETFSWDALNRIVDEANASPLKLEIRGGSEGEYAVDGSITLTPTPTGLHASVAMAKLYAKQESKWDRGTSADEPFVVVLVSSPAGGETIAWRSPWQDDVDTGETRELNHTIEIDVPRHGGLIVAVQVWESDDESESDRDAIRDAFARGYDERTVNQRSQFLDALGRAVAPEWKVSTVEAYAFLRGPVVQVANMASNQALDQWVPAGGHVDIPLAADDVRSCEIGNL